MQTKKLLFIVIIICLTFQMLYGQYKEFLYGDSVRTYAVYEPSLDPNPDGYPLVIGLHGASSEGYAFIATAGLILKANAEKFIVACPNSLRYNFLTWWNAGGIYEDITGGTDDLGFISALIDTMIEKYNVDTTRVYVMGFSNGAAMAYRVAAELSPKIAAMGVSSGQMLYEYCNPEFPVAIIHFHGLNDDKFPYYGSSDSAQAVPPVDSTMAIWRGINNCSSIADTIFNDNDIIGRKWNSSTGLSDIILYTNPEGVHEWPRPANWGISATDLIWDFLKLQQRIIETNINDSLFYATVSVNGETSEQMISYVKRDKHILIDAHLFCDLVGGKYFPMGQNYGLTVQYGKIISFAANQYQYGFVAFKMVEMQPPAEAVNDIIMAPINFLAQVVDGNVNFVEADQHLEITTSAPSEIGDVIPEAKTLTDALSQQNYTVQQGAIDRVNAIELYVAGYQADCNGNNANYPYLMMQTPPCPEAPCTPSIPMFYTMRPDEAFILIGRTPPECTYYSYRSYLFSRYFEDASPNRTKIYASLGDTQSLYNMSEGRNVPDSFNRFFMLISAADKNTTDAILNAAMALGINEDNIYVDVIPGSTMQMGLDEKADFFNFFHRAVLFDDPAEEYQFTNNPPLEWLRITPNVPATPDYLLVPELRTRGTGSTEFYLNDGLEQLRQQIINRYIADCDTINLVSYQWIPEGYEAIETRFNARGENRDALYLRTPFFQFQEHDIIVVFGANHAKTSKATYCNAGILGVPALNGLGGVDNLKFQGTAQEYLADSTLADNFYVWKFARTAVDARTYVVPPDTNNDYTGIDYGALAVMVFRSYVEPDTKVGPAASELIMDQAILFRPKSTAIEKNNEFSHKNFTLYQNYPNPFNPTTIIKYFLPKEVDVTLKLFNMRGQEVKTLVNKKQLAGNYAVHWDGRDNNGIAVSSGIYFYRIQAGKITRTNKMLLVK